ncbi:MAG: pyridoxal phosphate-dependent aminotransferase [Planktomarina sp.]
MQPSKRITGLTEGKDNGWGLFHMARQMITEGHDVIELTIGEHDIRTEPHILDAMHQSALGGHTGYASVPGITPLRTELAKRITQRTGVPTDIDNIAITPGGQAALLVAHMAVCDPGDTALFCDPYYATYPGTIRAVGAVPQSVACDPGKGFQPTYDDIAHHAPGAKSLLINTPNNPTGGVYSEATIKDICRATQDFDLWLISDEVYDTQIWEGRHIPPRGQDGMAERTLVIGSMSKSHAMTGSRIGWVCGPKDIVAHIINLSTHTTYGVPGFIQDAAFYALRQGDELEQRIAAPFQRRRDIAWSLLQGQNLVKAVRPDGAMYMMLDIRATGLSGLAFAEKLLHAEKIAVMPGESFGKAAAGHIRVAMTVDDAAFEDAIKRLLRFAAEVR